MTLADADRPRDQELRFTVHDSPDYFQLKVSVFNDDKKTELIGECWIDLRDIVLPGGGQNDQWFQLNYKGKYAGEIRMEITYYDSRPKPEKPAKMKSSSRPEGESSTIGNPRTVPKRRPLPSDPVTGKPGAPLPAPASPDKVEPQPPRPQPSPNASQPPLVPANYTNAPQAAPVQAYSQPQTYHHHQQQQPYHQPQPYPQQQQQQQQQQYSQQPYPQQPTPPEHQYHGRDPNGYPVPPPRRDVPPPPQHHHVPERPRDHYSEPGYAHSPQHYQPPYDQYAPSLRDMHFPQPSGVNGYEEGRPPPPPVHRVRAGTMPAMNPPHVNGVPPPVMHMRRDTIRNDAYRQSSSDYPGRPTYKAQDPGLPLPAPQYRNDPPPPPPPVRHYSYDSTTYDINRGMQAPVEDVPEPMHHGDPRSSGRWVPQQPYPQTQPPPPHYNTGYDVPPPSNPSPRASMAGMDAPRYGPPPPEPQRHSIPNGYPAPPAHDVPRREPPEYQQPYGRHSEPMLPQQQPYGMPKALTYRNESEDPVRHSVPPIPPSLVPGIDPNIAQEISERLNQDRRQTRQYTQQPIPEPPRGRTMERGYENGGSPATYGAAPPPPPPQNRAPVTYQNGPSTSSVNVVIKSRAYSPMGRDPSPNPAPAPGSTPRSQQTIKRKSVSPRPPTAEDRKISSVPFSPDSYDVLNPKASTAALLDQPVGGGHDYDEETGKIITHDGRRVDPTDHLPMESWAPEPEPKGTKQPSPPPSRQSPVGPQPQPQVQSQASNSGSGSEGRRLIRVGGRPQSMMPVTNTSSSNGFGSDPVKEAPTPPTSTGRNKLQKKAIYRQSTSALPAPVMSGANGSGPSSSTASLTNSVTGTFRRHSGGRELMDHHSQALATISRGQNMLPDNRQPLSRASTFDYPTNDNYSPTGSGGYRGSSSPGRPVSAGSAAPPPLPAKVPLALPAPGQSEGESSEPVMSGALQLHSRSRRFVEGGVDGQLMSLEEELRQIDIGTGRSARRAAAAAAGGYGGYGY